MKKVRIILSTFSILFISMNINAQEGLFTEKLVTKEKLDYLADYFLNISNMNGNIEIRYWDENYIECNSEVVATGWDKEETIEFCEKIAPIISFDDKCKCIRITMDYKHFKRRCNCKDGHSHLYKDWFKKIEVKDFTINYLIYIPKNQKKLYVHNNYGDINIDNYTGQLRLNLKNGLLISDSLIIKNNSYINLTKSAIDAGYISSTNSNIRISFCDEIFIDQLFSDNVKTQNSTLNIDILKCENFNTMNDSMRIGELRNTYIKGAFSKIFVDKLLGSASFLFLSRGKVVIDSYSNFFSDLKLSGKYSSFKISLPQSAFYFQPNISDSKIKAPEKFASGIDPDRTFNDLKEAFGFASSKAKISIDCENCEIELYDLENSKNFSEDISY